MKILVECDSPDLQVSADFTELDSTYEQESVSVKNNGDNTYLIEYRIGGDNTRFDGQNIPIPITVSDGLESIEEGYMISLDNSVPVVNSVRVKRDNLWVDSLAIGEKEFSLNMAFANGDTVELQVTWDGSGYDMSADFSALDSAYRPGGESAEAPGEEVASTDCRVSHQLSGSNSVQDGENRAVIIKGVDLAGNESQYVLRLNLDNTAPRILSVSAADDDSVYKNGDTVELLVKVDGWGYEATGDFSALDSTYPGASQVRSADNGDGTYTIKYDISKENAFGADAVKSNIRIVITVTDMVGNSAADSSMVVELDNIPPKLHVESPQPDALVFEARIEVKGQTESDAAVTIEPKPALNSAPDALADGDGNFSSPATLDVGRNTVTVTAADVAGNLTTENLTVTYLPRIRAAEGGSIYLPEKRDDGIPDNDTRITAPPDAAERDFTVEIAQLESPPPAMDNPAIGSGVISPLVAYEFTLKDEFGVDELSMAFLKPVQLLLQCQGLKTLDGIGVICRWDGVKWNRLGGEEDRTNGTVKTAVNSLSIFGVFRGTTVTEYNLRGAFPNPFTPNGDGVNDMVSVYLDNPDNANTVIRIYDLRGALIRQLEDGLASWDGMDDASQPAAMGVYIYQVEVAGKTMGGTIVLAR